MHKIFSTTYIIWILFFSTYCFGQNLILNHSFENGAKCDGETERIDTLNSWKSLSGNPSFINLNCPLSKNSKAFIKGMKLPNAAHGNVHAVVKCSKKGDFLLGQLTESLLKNKQYLIKMQVRRPIAFCTKPVSEIGVYLSDTALDETIFNSKFKEINALKLTNNDGKAIMSQYNWEEISGLYLAKGGEKYIHLGNFININEGINNDSCSYLFVDFISLELFEQKLVVPFLAEKELVQNQVLNLSRTKFDANQNLDKNSYAELDELIAKIKDLENIKIEVSCHTDNLESLTKSKKITELRCKQIEDYLIKNGLNKSKFICIPKGSLEPIKLNKSKANRILNNRVELKVFKI